MNDQLNKIIQATKNSPKDEITFKIFGASKDTLNLWIKEMAKENLKAQVVTLSSGDTGLHIVKTSGLKESISFEAMDIMGYPSIRLNKKVDSSAISEISWEDDKLTIEFNSGQTYAYDGISKEMAEDFINAPSVGRYFQKNIKDKYSFTQLGTALAK